MLAAIVTGGLRGLGRAMSFGLCEAGFNVLAVGHIDSDVPFVLGEARERGFGDRFVASVADLRRPPDCDRVVEEAIDRFGAVDVLVNNAALTFTYIWPDRYRRTAKAKPWEAGDEIVQTVMDTNYVAADQMARRCVPMMVERGWGRLINVTTNLATMNDADSSAYGASKAALEMATESWAKSLAGTGVTANILNPGFGANTDGIAAEIRDMSRRGEIQPLVEPQDMVAPLQWLVSSQADCVNGFRFDANAWDRRLAPGEAAGRAARRAGFLLQPAEDPLQAM